MRLLIIRHGDPDYERDCLTERGRVQARAAAERLREEGISVICIFTGTDDELPGARMVYGQDLVRIRDVNLFADTVGKLIIDQIRNYAM